MFDVMLSHNSADKPLVRRLASELEQRGVKPWLDEWELAPGSVWQDELTRIIRTVPAVIVLIGPSGIGAWEMPEIRACLDESVARGLAVIPVLLPGVTKGECVPLFLRQFTWQDLSEGFTEEGVSRIVKAIKGKEPGWRAADEGGRAAPVVEEHPARTIWRQKMSFYQQQEAVASNPAVRFELQALIAEAKAKIKEYGSGPT
jgi:hypothetical protein